MKKQVRYAIFIVLILMVSMISMSSSNPGNQQQNQQAKDQAIKSVIVNQLIENKIMQGNNIQVTVSNDTITLNGAVSTLASKRMAVQDAHKVAEGYQIVNNITVQAPQLTDKALADAVLKRLSNHVFYSIFDWIIVNADNGVVTLAGWVYVPWHKTEFVHQAEKVAGVKKLVDDIKVLPTSSTDEQIRERAARLIYNNPTFENYANNVNPPIHIIVDNGHVILEGVVDSNYAKGLAGNIVRFDTDALSVDNQLMVAK